MGEWRRERTLLNLWIFVFNELFLGRLFVPQTIEEDSDEEDSSSAEFVIEYVTDSDQDFSDGDEEW